MAKLVTLKTNTDNRGSLTVLQNEINFLIKRVYYIYNINPNEKRGGHRHKKNKQAMMCLHGSCQVFVNNASSKTEFHLNDPSQCLILDPEDWHKMHAFAENTILLVVSSENYDSDDYIYEEYV